MTVLLMADVTRMAWRSRTRGDHFSPRVLLDLYLGELGPEGTLLVPTYNFDLRPGESYDVRRTPPITGALGMAALAHPAFRRTAHPLHSFAVAGGSAGRYLDAADPSSFGPGSPFALMREEGAVLIAWDLPLNDALTAVHHAEEMEGVPYRRWKDILLHHTGLDGREEVRVYRHFAKRPGHMNELSGLEPLLETGGALTRHGIDGHTCLRVDLAAAHALTTADIREHGARRIHVFSWGRWLRDMLKPLVRPRERSRSAQARDAHAAGTP